MRRVIGLGGSHFCFVGAVRCDSNTRLYMQCRTGSLRAICSNYVCLHWSLMRAFIHGKEGDMFLLLHWPCWVMTLIFLCFQDIFYPYRYITTGSTALRSHTNAQITSHDWGGKGVGNGLTLMVGGR